VQPANASLSRFLFNPCLSSGYGDTRLGAETAKGDSRPMRASDSIRYDGHQNERRNMLGWTLIFLMVALIAGVLGFAGIAGAAAGIAKILFVIFLVLFLVSLIARLASNKG
jgi:uncharacterized membrane protein YtjA (UPF0391 family)